MFFFRFFFAPFTRPIPHFSPPSVRSHFFVGLFLNSVLWKLVKKFTMVMWSQLMSHLTAEVHNVLGFWGCREATCCIEADYLSHNGLISNKNHFSFQ